MHALACLKTRVRLVAEVPVTTVFHADLYIVRGCLVHRMLHRVARQAAAKCTDYGRGRTTMPVANLSTGKTAQYSAAQGTQARGGLSRPDRVDGHDLAGVRVYSGSGRESRSRRRAIEFVRCVVLRRRGNVMMAVRLRG